MSSFEDFMNKIGFSGYGDHTGVGKTIFLSIVFMGLTTMFLFGVVSELLIGIPVIQDNFRLPVVLVVTVVIAFFAIFWRHKPLVIIFSVFSAIGIFNIVHAVAIERDKAFPTAFAALVAPSEEELANIQALRAERLARITMYDTTTGGDYYDIPTGAIVILIQNPKNDMYRVQCLYKGEEITIGASSFEKLRTDRTIKVRADGNLLTAPETDAAVIKEIAKGQRVTLTGESSDDAAAIEVVYNGDTGWLASENLFAPVRIKLNENIKLELKMPSIPLAVIALALAALIYFIHFRKSLKQYRAYHSEKRKEFIWFENYIKKYGEPSVSRAFGDVNSELFKFAIVCLICYAFSFVLGILFSVLYAHIYHSISSQFEKVLLNVGTVLGPLGAVISAWVIWHSAVKGVIKVECTHCGCPYSRAMTSTQNIVDGERNDKTTVTRTTKNIDTGYTSSESNTYYNLVYVGRVIEKFKCFNCKRTEQKVSKREWKGPPGILSGITKDANRPDESIVEFNNDSLEELSNE